MAVENFVVERFDPDEYIRQKDNEEKILKKLKKKLAKKRKLAESEGKPEEEKKEDVDAAEPNKKKRKKKEKEKKGETVVDTGFTVLGEELSTKKKKVSRVLPYWLANPDIAEVDLNSEQLAVDDMKDLDVSLKEKLKKRGIKYFFPVQRQIIPILLEAGQPSYLRPNDVCVSAPTGSGKTLAFVLPIIHSLKSRMVPKVRALVVLPTQDLALQVFKVFNIFCEGTGLRVKLLTGQQSLSQEQQSLYRVGSTGLLHQQVDILVVTPGRLAHHIRDTPQLDLTALRYLVIDEADRMMSNMADDWLNVLESAVYRGKRLRPGPLNVVNARQQSLPLQKLLFSATLSQDPIYRCVVPAKTLSGKVNTDADEITEFSIPAELKQFTVRTDLGRKPLVVSLLVEKLELKSVLVFTKSNESTHRLALVLSNLGFSCAELSSDIKMKRKKVLSKLKNGTIRILVCSDALARGIDVENLDGVISYDCPQFIKAYIHRVGRTGRAGRSGVALTLLEPTQRKNFKKMTLDGGIANIEEYEVTEEELEAGQSAFNAALEQTKRQMQQERDAEHSTKNFKKKFANP
ncbi:ATP-dependent RNA helicase DDX51 [Eurytemora carolleeae]|uniref:ATP-dependent RNA helicase DDX51 n=1 Tax=Eurytemora carolleeae TaxID=1294199 RepID=UPI000C768347|nr:ATP-dependent RNA helicase DDX51 [Eurytemora carolleeae]|eukprot:XP_023332629.1 ATP-dependent RNA helicase DDX51-like [Eurytemora affinis]